MIQLNTILEYQPKIAPELRSETKEKSSKMEQIYCSIQIPADWDWSWVVENKKAPFRGTLPKRLAAWVLSSKKILGDSVKPMSSNLISHIGNFASDDISSLTNVQFFQLCETYDWNAGAFSDDNSCYFVRSGEPLKVLRDNGVLALLVYDVLKQARSTQLNPDFNRSKTEFLKAHRLAYGETETSYTPINRKEFNHHYGRARCWVVPNFPETGMYALFNGYGYQGDALNVITKAFAEYLGLSYLRVKAYNMSRMNSIVYVNVGTFGDGDKVEQKPRAMILGTPEQLRPLASNPVVDLRLKDTSNYYNDEDIENDY